MSKASSWLALEPAIAPEDAGAPIALPPKRCAELAPITRTLGFEDESFDHVYAPYVVSVVPDLPAAMAEMKRVFPGLHLSINGGIGDLDAAREAQRRAAAVIATVGRFGYRAASKAVMGLLGVEFGPTRPPLVPLDEPRREALRAELEAQGFLAAVTTR